MKRSIVRGALAGTFGLALLCASFVRPNTNTGSDVVEIYLNNKMIVQQVVNKPVELKNLPISEANSSDNLVVFFKSCHAPGTVDKNRSIIIKDVKGKIVKEWTFNRAGEKSGSMVIPVKEVLSLIRESGDALTLIYKGNNGDNLTTRS